MIYCFKLKSSAEIEDVWDQLEQAGVQVLYSEDDQEDAKEIYGIVPTSLQLDALLHQFPIQEILQKSGLPEINWQEQWEIHGHHYHDGYVHVDLHDFGFNGDCHPLRLIPGPGFGDLSHPTTKLVLMLMAKYLHGEAVLDVGCGSGILSLAAIAMGAPKAIGLDIDLNALDHARKNVSLNEMEMSIEFYAPETWTPLNPPLFVLMNMISSEQICAWNSLKSIHSNFKEVITSGIPKEEKDSYLNLTRSWGLTCIEEIELEGWLGFFLTHTS
jgi:ribosomal protein L11 methyltransferase